MRRLNQWARHNKKLFAAGVFVIFGIGVAYAVQNVYALSGSLPGGLDAEAGGKQGAIELHLKYLNVAQVTENRMAAYYPGWDASANGKSITITGGPRGNVCNIDQAVRDGPGVLKIKIDIEGDSKTYTRDLKDVCGSDADSNFYGNTFDFPDGTLIKDPISTDTKQILLLYTMFLAHLLTRLTVATLTIKCLYLEITVVTVHLRCVIAPTLGSLVCAARTLIHRERQIITRCGLQCHSATTVQ